MNALCTKIHQISFARKHHRDYNDLIYQYSWETHSGMLKYRKSQHVHIPQQQLFLSPCIKLNLQLGYRKINNVGKHKEDKNIMVVISNGQNIYQNHSSKSETKYICFIHAECQSLLYLKGTQNPGLDATFWAKMTSWVPMSSVTFYRQLCHLISPINVPVPS